MAKHFGLQSLEGREFSNRLPIAARISPDAYSLRENETQKNAASTQFLPKQHLNASSSPRVPGRKVKSPDDEESVRVGLFSKGLPLN